MRVVTHITVQLERENEIMLVKCLAGFLEHQNHLKIVLSLISGQRN